MTLMNVGEQKILFTGNLLVHRWAFPRNQINE